MKTLDEALDVIFVKGEGDESRVKAEAQRFVPTLREIMSNDRVKALCSESMHDLAEDREVKDEELGPMIWLHAFTDGVKIGMEMERQEFQEPKKPRRKKS